MRKATLILAAAAILLLPADGFAGKKRSRGILKIESTVDGALVKVNNLSAGKTPLKPMRLKKGTYTIHVYKLGHLAFEAKVRVKAGKTAHVMADLLPVAGVLDAKVAPEGAKIFVDGAYVGVAPAQLELKLGRRHVEFRMPGYETVENFVHAVPGETTTLKVKLMPAFVDPLEDDLALVPLAPPSPSADLDDPLADDLALVPLKKPSDPLALEPLVPLAPLGPSRGESSFGPTEMAEAVPNRTEWYENWWVWGSASAVLVSSAVVTAVVLSDDDGNLAVDSVLDLSQASPSSW